MWCGVNEQQVMAHTCPNISEVVLGNNCRPCDARFTSSKRLTNIYFTKINNIY